MAEESATAPRGKGFGLAVALAFILLFCGLFIVGRWNKDSELVYRAAMIDLASACRNPDECVKRDLPVQYIAAIAAKESASINRIQLIISVIGALGLAATLYFNFKSSAAALDAVRVAQQTAKHQLRAYIDAEPKSLVGTGAKEQPKIEIRYKNIGQTLARNVSARSEIYLISEGDVVEPFVSYDPEKTDNGLHPHASRVNANTATFALAHDWNAPENSKAALMVLFLLHYEDIYGDSHSTRLAFAYPGGKTQAMFFGEGNSAD